MGYMYLCFCWTLVPTVLGILEALLFLAYNDYGFMISNKVRLEGYEGEEYIDPFEQAEREMAEMEQKLKEQSSTNNA